MDVSKKATAELPTRYGNFLIHVYHGRDGKEHLALVKGIVKNNTLVRMQSECLTGEVLHSKRCDCQEQLRQALQKIGREEHAVLLYLRQEGMGIGLANKIKAYALQDKGMDHVDANKQLGFHVDEREYAVGAAILKEMNVSAVRLMTNNPLKVAGLQQHGIVVTERIPMVVKPTKYTKKYLQTKKEKLGHFI